MKSLDMDNVVQKYLSGTNAEELGREFGVKGDTVRAWLKKRNVPLRARGESTLMKSPLTLHVSTIIERYIAGESVNKLAQAYNTSRRCIEIRLIKHGVQLRNQSEAESAKWRRMTSVQRQRQVAKAHNARRGQKDSWETQCRRAQSWYLARLHISPKEDALAAMLRSLEIPVLQQFPVGAYNVDLLIHGTPIAIEIEAGNWSNKQLGFDYTKRMKYILDQGYIMLFVFIKNKPLEIRPVTDYLIRFLETFGWDKPAIGQYGMIRGDGQLTTTRTMDFDSFTRINGF